MSHAHEAPHILLRPAGAPGARTFSAAAVAALLLVPFGLAAQQAAPEPRWGWTGPVARYGKWVTAAAAIGLTVLAAREHDQSADAWDQLLLICRTDNADCAVGADGRYVNTIAEGHYQLSLYYDARARRRLIAGQAALVVSAALFIADLARGRDGPPNVPFDPNRLVLGTSAGGGTRVGLRLEF